MLLVKFIGDNKENGSFICRLAGWWYAFVNVGKVIKESKKNNYFLVSGDFYNAFKHGG